MRPSKIISAESRRVMPAGAGRTNSTTPNASATSASVVRPVKVVFRASHIGTNCPPQPGVAGLSRQARSRYVTDGLSPIFMVPPSSGAKKRPSAPRPATWAATKAVLPDVPA
jgi:hypothetical protein